MDRRGATLVAVVQRYNLFTFGGMIGERSRIRVDAFAEALRRSITPGCTVLDIGTGMGFFAVLAATFGAGHVYGVDPNRSLDIARQIAAANGVADRTTFVRGLSTGLDLPRRADVIISDIRGALPWMQTIVASIVDARERLLAPGGTLIPGRDEVWGTLVEAPELYAKYVAPWDDNAFGLDLSAARVRTTDHVAKGHVQAENLLTEPQRIALLDWTTITDPNTATVLEWEVPRAGTVHGLSVWFDTELVPGVGYSNAPTAPHIPIYSQMFFPFRDAVGLDPGDRVTVRFQAKLSAAARYVWSWATRVTSASGAPKASFDQASFATDFVVPETDD